MKPYNHWGKILKDTNLWKLMYSKKDPLLVKNVIMNPYYRDNWGQFYAPQRLF